MEHHERRKQLLKLLEHHQHASVDQMVAWLEVSPATVRRDIHWLAERRLLARTRGGMARLASRQQASLVSQSFHGSLDQNARAKRAIARHAASLCQDGDTIIINGGTTTFMMAEFLATRQLKVITNSFAMAERLLSTSDNEVILPGGTVYREQNVILSPFARDVHEHHYASKMFMSVYGLSMLGLMEADPVLIEAEKTLIEQAEQIIVLADSSKLERRAGLILCGLNRVHMVITDTLAGPGALRALEGAGVRVMAVEPDTTPLRPARAY